MRETPPRRRRAAGALCSAVLLAGFAPAGGPPSAAPQAVSGWIAGDVEGTLAALAEAPAGRERDLNRAVVQLYAGEAASAEAALLGLRLREPGWAPAWRWLARAQEQLGQAEAVDTIAALLETSRAEGRDHLWAGGLFLERGRTERARAAFGRALQQDQTLDLAWLGLAEAENRLGHAEASEAARERVPHLLAARLAAVGAPSVLPVLRPERLRYRVKYLFFNLATLTLETSGSVLHRGRPARRVVVTAKSNAFFFHIDSHFESLIADDGTVLAHRHVGNESDTGDYAAAYDMDGDGCTVRTVRDGLLAYDRLPLPPSAQDGISVLLLARAVARTGGTFEVPTAVDGTWKTTRLKAAGEEHVRWRGREVQTTRVHFEGRYRGAAGLSGRIDLWMTSDPAATPLKARMKVAIGSVSLELFPDEPDARGDPPRS